MHHLLKTTLLFSSILLFSCNTSSQKENTIQENERHLLKEERTGDNDKKLKDATAYQIKDAIEFYISNELELRGADSEIGAAVEDFKKGLNKNIKVGTSDLIFQPQGTDDQEAGALADVTRITVKYFKKNSDEYPEWNESMPSDEINPMNDYFKAITLQTLNEMPFETELIEWNKIETGKVNGQTYIKTSYAYLSDQKEAYTASYQFFNSNEKVIISIVTDYPYPEKWKHVFESAIQSFDFKHKK